MLGPFNTRKEAEQRNTGGRTLFRVDIDGYLRDEFGEFIWTTDVNGNRVCVTINNRGNV